MRVSVDEAGRTVAPERSITNALPGIGMFFPTFLILFPSTRITAFSIGVSDLPSMSLPQRIAVSC